MLPLCVVQNFSPVIPPLLDAPAWVGEEEQSWMEGARDGNIFFLVPACDPSALLCASLPECPPLFCSVSHRLHLDEVTPLQEALEGVWNHFTGA